MNDSGTNQSTFELAERIESLRRQVFILLLALIVVSSSLATYLGYQSHVLSKSVEGIKPQALQIIQTYNKVNATLNPAIVTNFVNQVMAYGVAHPEFRPVLEKYGWKPPQATTAPAVAPKK